MIMWCVCSCGRTWSLCDVVLVLYLVGAVVALTVMRVLLFVLDVSRQRECEDDGNASVRDDEGVVAVSAGHEYVGGARGSGIVSIAADVLGLHVVRGMRGVSGVCGMGMCLARGGVGGGWIRGFYLVRRWGWGGGGLGQSLEGWGGVMYV